MTSSESFNDLDQWMKMVEKATNQKQPIFALIANKSSSFLFVNFSCSKEFPKIPKKIQKFINL